MFFFVAIGFWLKTIEQKPAGKKKQGIFPKTHQDLGRLLKLQKPLGFFRQQILLMEWGGCCVCFQGITAHFFGLPCVFKLTSRDFLAEFMQSPSRQKPTKNQHQKTNDKKTERIFPK